MCDIGHMNTTNMKANSTVYVCWQFQQFFSANARAHVHVPAHVRSYAKSNLPVLVLLSVYIVL